MRYVGRCSDTEIQSVNEVRGLDENAAAETVKVLCDLVQDVYCEKSELFAFCPDDILYARALAEGVISETEYELIQSQGSTVL